MSRAVNEYPYEIRRQAMEWRVRIDNDDVDENEQVELDAWLSADVRHEQAFDRAGTVWSAYGTLDHSKIEEAYFKESLSERLRGAIEKLPDFFNSTGARIGGFVTAMAVLIAVAGGIYGGSFWNREAPGEEAAFLAEYQTGIGEFKTVSLSDRTGITLGPATRIEVAMSESRREIKLAQGAAVFDVTEDKDRPFVVKADAFSAKVLGTVFDVRYNGGIIRLSVSEGRVEASHPVVINEETTGMAVRREVAAGEQLTANADDGLTAVRPLRSDNFASWRDDRLRYLGAPLSELVADANRYSDVPIVIQDTDADLNALKVTFAFDGKNVDGMLSALPSMFPVVVDRIGQDAIIIRATAAE